MPELQPITVSGKAGTVAYFDAQWRMVSPERSVLAKVVFDDGTSAFFTPTPVRKDLAEFDESQPRDDHGRWAGSGGSVERSEFADAPRVFKTADDVERLDDAWGGGERWMWNDKSSILVTGKVLDRASLPDRLYHVTTNAPAVEGSGVLLGQVKGAGLGGGQEDGVSFTTSETSAALIQNELTRSVRIARGDDGIEDFARYATEDEKRAGLPAGSLARAVVEAQRTWDGNKFILERSFVSDSERSGYHGPAPTGEELERKRTSLVKDAFNAYLWARKSDGKGHPLLDNPILFGDQKHLRNMDPRNIATISVTPAQIPARALVTSGSDDFLHEVRVYADVPVTPKRTGRKDLFDENQPRDDHGRWTSTLGPEVLDKWTSADGTGINPPAMESESGYQWHEEHGLGFAKRITDEQITAFNDYGGFSYKQINGILRGNPPMSKSKERPATDTERELLEAKAYTVDGGIRRLSKTHVEIPIDDHSRLVFNVYNTLKKDGFEYSSYLERDVPDERTDRYKRDGELLNDAIREHGITLTEPMLVHRYAFFPGLTNDELVDAVGRDVTERGFTSTMLGPANNRLQIAPAAVKQDVLYAKHDTKYEAAWGHPGVAVQFDIALPSGTRVASVEAARRVRDYLGERDYSQITSKGQSLRDARIESEVMIGSGARFRINDVIPGWRESRFMHLTEPVTLVKLEYVGGGSSEPRP